MRYIPILFLLLIDVLSVSGQPSYGIAAFYDTRSVFFDQFDDNSNDWITDNSWLKGKIENGRYLLTCKNFKNSNGLSYKPINIDKDRDYEIETSLQIVKGSGGLILGMNEDFDHYRIEIIDGDEVVVVKNLPSKGRVNKLFNISAPAVIKPGAAVKITIRKISGVFYLYINEILFKEFNNITPAGSNIGFISGVNSEISADYLRVSYLEKRTSPLIAIDSASMAKDADNTKPPVTIVTSQAIAGTKFVPIPDAPAIKWVSPSSDSIAVNSYSARIRAVIKSLTELKSVLIYVNGASKGEAEWSFSADEKGSYAIERTISLNPGINNVYLVATNFKGTSRSESRFFINPAATLPVITWKYPPENESAVNQDRISIDVCINSPSGINSARILVNGEERGNDNVFQASASGDCNIRWQKQVILKEGENSIYVLANNIAGSTTSESRIIRYSPAIAEKRIALVIGNSEYRNNVSLKNPVNDANLIEATLITLGFDVIKEINSGRDSMIDAIREFSRRLADNNVALFYYAGHGLQVDGVNYMIPVDAELRNKEDCKWEAVDVTIMTDEFKKNITNTNIVILDACRNNPYRSWARGNETGFKALGPINGTIISFATSEGATAADGSGANGLFTEELVKQMIIPQPIESVFKKTRKQVIDRSNGQQTPTEWSYLTGDFYFKK
jgi:hypothetical protein